MLAQMSPYTPSLYQPGGYGRYRQYPRQVVTSIPGAGFDVGDMVWAEQELNLDGSNDMQPYGNYAAVPLRGLGLPMLATSRLPLFTGQYWQERANQCTEFADEGACLARIARHVPVTIGGIGSFQGMGDTTATNVQTAIDITAGLFSNPDATLRRYGPPIVAAADQHVVNPIIDRIGESMAPYVVRYLVPPLVLLYIVSGVGAFYAYRAAEGRGIKANRRRRRRRN